MLTLWLTMGLMTVVALGFCAWPFWRQHGSVVLVSRQQTNLSLYKERLVELKQQKADQVISADEFAQAEHELQVQLLQDTDNKETDVNPVSNMRRGVLWLMVGFVPMVAALLYYHWGSETQLAAYYQQQRMAPKVQAMLEELQTPDAVIERLKERLAIEPDSAKGWYLLGRIYFTQAEFTKAADAFAKAYKLDESDTNVAIQYAQSLYFANQHHLQPSIKQIIDKVLEAEPGNFAALNLLAVAAYEQKDFDTAIHYWEQMLSLIPEMDPAHQEILNAISQAQVARQGGQKTTATEKLTVQVDLAESLRKQVTPDTTVFIYAKSVDGPPMPAAIVRKQVKDLPATVTLSNDDAMNPAYTISQLSKALIVARISTSGNAMPEAGDLEGQSKPLVVSEQSGIVHITIDHTI